MGSLVVPVTLAIGKEWNRDCLHQTNEVIGHIVVMHLPRVASNEVAGRPA
jgi:hypothetical protein